MCYAIACDARRGDPWHSIACRRTRRVRNFNGMGAEMPRVKLTDRFVLHAKPTEGERTDYFDETTRGLALRVSEHGTKSWTFHFTSPRDGKRARLTIGTYPATSLAAARGRALEAKSQVEEGQDPRLSDQAAAGMTVAGLVEAYLADPKTAALRSKPEIERRLRKHLVPTIGGVRIADLRRRDVRNVIDPILRRGKKIEATRVFDDTRTMVRWGLRNDYLETDPLAGMEKPAQSTPGTRVLSDDEIRTLWYSTVLPEECQRIVKLCLVTGQRVGEVAGMVPEELDLTAREWKLPGRRTKNGHDHIVPLSDLAIELIGERPGFRLTSKEVSLLIFRMRERLGVAAWSIHDLRRTALTGMARLGVAPIVLGHVANHRSTTKAGMTLSVYVHHGYEREKREALDMWADRVRGIVAGAAEVVPLVRAAQ